MPIEPPSARWMQFRDAQRRLTGPQAHGSHALGRQALPAQKSANSTAGFVELSPSHVMTPDSLHIALAADRAVRRAVRNSTKTSQGNVGSHYMEQNLLVYVAGFERPVEFELTRHLHMKPAPGRSYTVTARFKQPPIGMEAVAWQVLLRITKGKELLPQWVQQYARRSLARIGHELAGDATAPAATADGPAPAPQAPPQDEREKDHPLGGHESTFGPGTVAGEEAEKEPGSASSPTAVTVEDAGEEDHPLDGHENTFEPDWDAPAEDTGAELADDAKAELQEAADVDEATLRQRRIDRANTFLEFSSVDGPLPRFVEVVWQQGMSESPDTELARATQANVVEHARWRATDNFPVDAASVGHIQHMRAVLHAANVVSAQARTHVPDLRDIVNDRVPAPGSASATQASQSLGDFLHAASRRSLQVTAFHSKPKPGEPDRRPALRKLSRQQLETADGCARAVVQLATGLHKGEVVELDPEQTRWVLVEKAPGSASASTGFSAQWFCVAGGQPAGVNLFPHQWPEFGQPRGQIALADIRDQIAGLQGRLGNADTVDWRTYCPDWVAQRYRCVVPCASTTDYEWVRLGPVVTLGELFVQLGKFFTAKRMCAFFRTLRIVALKRDKLSTNEAPGSASAVPGPTTGGVAGGPLQAHRIMTQFRKEGALVAEYIDLRGLTTQRVEERGPKRMMKEAINFMRPLLLRDLTPPWITEQFPQALPGDGLLSKFTRPSFLCWPGADADVPFGAAVSGVPRGRAGMVQKELAGVIARPLYQCTALVDGHMCSNVASMSRFMQNPEGRPPCRCHDCAGRLQGAGDAPGSASAALRALWAYPMVRDPEGQPTPVRVSAPLRLLVHAPPVGWGWRATPTEPPPRAGVVPVPTVGEVKESGRSERLYIYNEADSAAIWFGSQSFKAMGQ
ncbi:unnamed protein product [Prorocentrum cordatum]|uniref:Uncharacterized protein n=1 Tax=Prorocentrum cordatum TaxID=2364126 RepID=A0ABN9Q5J0_9DINO|nr:unnamed protein product [Polarella glacialis]